MHSEILMVIFYRFYSLSSLMKKKHYYSFSGNFVTKLYVCKFLIVCLGTLRYITLSLAFLKVFCKLKQDVKVTAVIGPSCSTVSNRVHISKSLLKVLGLLMHSFRRVNRAALATPIWIFKNVCSFSVGYSA